MGERIGVSDDEWSLIGSLLPSERRQGCQPAQDNRLYFEDMMWMARTGAQWGHLPDEYGKWNSVFRRYRRWVETRVFDAMLETFTEMAGRDGTIDMIESAVVRAHPCAAGIKKDSGNRGDRRLTSPMASGISRASTLSTSTSSRSGFAKR